MGSRPRSSIDLPARAAELLAEGAVTERGVLLPENLDSEVFLSRLREHVPWEEEVRRDRGHPST